MEDDAFDVDGQLQLIERKKKKKGKKVKDDQDTAETDFWEEKHKLEIFIENLFFLIESDN